MKEFIACCGIDCENCDARIATIANDNNLREETAKKWREMYESANISVMSINCTGCRVAGVKFDHCNKCDIRKCVEAKGFNTCGDCHEIETCSTVGFVLQHVPDAKANLTRKGV
jgi:hypothetical protein